MRKYVSLNSTSLDFFSRVEDIRRPRFQVGTILFDSVIRSFVCSSRPVEIYRSTIQVRTVLSNLFSRSDVFSSRFVEIYRSTFQVGTILFDSVIRSFVCSSRPVEICRSTIQVRTVLSNLFSRSDVFSSRFVEIYRSTFQVRTVLCKLLSRFGLSSSSLVEIRRSTVQVRTISCNIFNGWCGVSPSLPKIPLSLVSVDNHPVDSIQLIRCSVSNCGQDSGNIRGVKNKVFSVIRSPIDIPITVRFGFCHGLSQSEHRLRCVNWMADSSPGLILGTSRRLSVVGILWFLAGYRSGTIWQFPNRVGLQCNCRKSAYRWVPRNGSLWCWLWCGLQLLFWSEATVFTSVKWFCSFMTERICSRWAFSGLLRPEFTLCTFYSVFMVSVQSFFVREIRSMCRFTFLLVVFCGRVWMPVAVHVGQIKAPETSRY